MKSILYAGAALMIGASIYGFVDYKKTSQSKEFTGMYVEEKKAESAAKADITTTEVRDAASEKKSEGEKPAKKKIKLNKKQKKTGEITAPIEPINPDESMTSELKDIEKSGVELTPSADAEVEKKIKKKKKLNHKIFSRAPIRDEVEIKETTEAVKAKKSVLH